MLYIIWIAAAIVFALAWVFRGYIFNGLLILGALLDATLDIACQLWIDISKMGRIFKRKPRLDQSEDFYHRD